MPATQFHTQLLDACRRLAGKGFFNGSADSISLRIPGSGGMVLASGLTDWRPVPFSDIKAVQFSTQGECAGLHAMIYEERTDVGAVIVSSPKGVRMLAQSGGRLPPIFDEQVRHIGAAVDALNRGESESRDLVKILRQRTNAVLLGEQLLCLGTTCERALCNTELYEKCALAYVIARASGGRVGTIPFWVRWIANHRLMRDERQAAVSYRQGQVPEGVSGY